MLYANILFLTGYPSPEWLGSIGSRYRVDPEFFNRFLDFRSINDRLSCFSVPPLPSSEWNLIKLSLLTIGLRTSYDPRISTRTIREDTSNVLAEKHHQIQAGAKVPVGTTVIRNISVLDEMNFAIEQHIFICYQPAEIHRGWAVLVWTDGGSLAGSDFMENPLSKALRLSSSFRESLLPIVVYKPMMGLNAHLLAKHCAVPSLHFGYGRFLRQNLASGHPFIALTEVFTLVASSEKHFLNMMELKLERAVLNSGGKPYNDGLENLRYFNTVLNRQVRRIKSTLAALSNAGHRNKWLKADPEPTERARREVEQDFEHLHEHAETLYRRCQEEIAVLMNSMAILESEKAIAQAGRMARLTFLAFIFVPMAFVSSFFSMNVPELQSVPLWAWFVASTVILTPSLALYWLDEDTRRRFKARARPLFKLSV
ncbi:hypothetical protein ACQRIT_005985 [Beauveria bassiana]